MINFCKNFCPVKNKNLRLYIIILLNLERKKKKLFRNLLNECYLL